MTLVRWIGAQMSLDEPDKRLDVICEAATIPDMRPAVLDSPAETVGTFLTIRGP
jgi:hypothetical protein